MTIHIKKREQKYDYDMDWGDAIINIEEEITKPQNDFE